MNFATARQAMIDGQLSTNQVVSQNILEAMNTLPREEFLPESRKAYAYIDEDLPLGEGRFLMEPMIMARLIQELTPKADEIILDVGSGCGYSAAVFSKLVQTVIAVEPIEAFLEGAQKVWTDLELCNIAGMDGRSDETLHRNGPYDMIFINGAVADIPKDLVAELKPHTGRLACVLREDMDKNGRAVLIRNEAGEASLTPLFDANIPYLKELTPQRGFSF